MNLRKIIFVFYLLFTLLSANAQTNIWTLKACIDTAIKRNISLNQGQLTTDENKINLEQSQDNLYPNLNLGDVHNFNFGRTLDPYSYQYTSQSISINNLSLTSSVTLFNGFQYLNTIRQNKFTYDASVKNVEKMKNDLSLNVLAGYMQGLVAYEAVDIAKAQMESTKGQVERTQKYVDAGKIAESNLLQIQSQLASDQLTIVQAENQLQLAKVTLMQLMNMPIVNDFNIERPKTTDVSPTPLASAEIYKTAESFLPEIESAKLSTSAAEAGYKATKALYLPKLSMSGTIKTGYSSGNSNVSSITTYEPQTIGYLQSNPSDQVIGLVPVTTINRTNYSAFDQFQNYATEAIGLNLTIPIFNNFLAKNNVALAKINIMNAQLNERAVKEHLRKSIETASTDMIAASNEYAAALQALKAEERTYKDLEKKFTVGMTSATDFLIEKANYLKSEQSVLQSKFNYLFKTKIVDFYLGKPIFIE